MAIVQILYSKTEDVAKFYFSTFKLCTLFHVERLLFFILYIIKL